MGDRHVIGFTEKANAPIIYLYSHWGGEDQYKIAANAIEAARPRFSHHDYATRIAISAIVGNDWNQELGYGIAVNEFSMPDRSDVLVINWGESQVDVYEGDCHEELKLVHSIGFDIFARITNVA
jgi:hypothetical protein